MKVLHITNNFPTKKLPIFGIFVKEQIDSLNDIGVESDVLFINGYEKGKGAYLFGIFRLFCKILFKRYDVIHCHHALSGLVYYYTPKIRHIPCVISFQNDPINEFGTKVYNKLKRKFDAFIFKNDSPFIKELERGYYLPNGVNASFFCPDDKGICRKKLGLSIDKRYIMFVSSFVIRKQKREDRFDEVMAILQNRYPECNYAPLKLVNIPRNQIPFYFNAANAYLMTSEFEGSPNAVKESLCCNTPVITTNVGNVVDMLGDIDGCFVCDPYDANTMAEAVHRICSSNYAFNGRDIFLQKGYGMNEVAHKIESIYKSILKCS